MLRRWVKVTVTRAPPPTYLSSVHCRRRCWALGEWKENLSELRQFCFSGDSRLRSCSSSCSYMSLWRSNADRFSSSCCCSRLFSIDCMGSKQGFFFVCLFLRQITNKRLTAQHNIQQTLLYFVVCHKQQLIIMWVVLKFFFNWSIIALQCCVSFWCTTVWISQKHTYVPSLLSLAQNWVICRDVDEPRVCHKEWGQSEREKKIT